MMPSSSSANKRKNKVVFDGSKFVSEEAQTRYYESVLGRTLIAERGLIVTPTGYPSISSVIRARGGVNSVLNLSLLLFLLLENSMPMLLSMTTGKFLLEENKSILVVRP